MAERPRPVTLGEYQFAPVPGVQRGEGGYKVEDRHLASPFRGSGARAPGCGETDGAARSPGSLHAARAAPSLMSMAFVASVACGFS